MPILLFFLALAIFFFLATPFFLLYMIVNPSRILPHIASPKDIGVKQKSPLPFLESKNIEHFFVRSFDGYELYCTLIPCYEPKAGTGRFVVISHGYLGTHLRSARFADIYLNLQYNVVVYDLRNHGKNSKDFISMGLRESRDLLCVINELRCRFGSGILVGLHGESMGAATSLLALDKIENLAFCISDCAFSDLSKLFEYLLRNRMHLPLFFLSLTDLLCRLIYNYSFFEIRPIEVVERTKIPVLFIHGSADMLIPPQMCMELFKNSGGYKEIELIDNAAHAASIETSPDGYRQAINRFLANAVHHIAVNSSPEKTKIAAA